MSVCPSIERLALLSVHTCPLATLGGKKTGGMNVYIYNLALEFLRRGIEVDIFTRYQGDCAPHIDHGFGDGVRMVHIPAGPDAPLTPIGHLDHLDEFSQGVQSFAANGDTRYDLIFSHYWLSGCVALDLRQTWIRDSYVPVVQMFHTLGRMKNRVAVHDWEREPGIRVEKEREVMESVDRIVAATPAEEAQLQWLYGVDLDKVVTIPPGVDLERFHPIGLQAARHAVGVPPDDRMILYVGRIEPLKGIDTLIRAIAILRAGCADDAPCLHLAIIGGNPNDPLQENAEMERLKQMRIDLGIEDVVTFLGARDQNTLGHYYSAAEVVVMPSHYESFGMVALEAMACGTPVIASEVGGLAFLVQDGETGYHVEAQNAQALAGKLSLILDDPTLREKLSRGAITYAQRFSWSRIADRLLSLFAQTKQSMGGTTRSRSSHPF